MTDNLKSLLALLQMDESGEEIAQLVSEFLIDSGKRNLLLIKLNEMKKELYTLDQEVRLSKAEEALKNVILSEKRPLTAAEVAENVEDAYKSLKHTSHASTVLNEMVKKGVLGKFKLGHNFYFTDPKEAVMGQLKRRGESPEECSPAEIARETGMPLVAVLNAIEELLS
ncbi:hypothetical protein ACFLW2_03275 [Chloroflexota bacterium]